MQQHFVSDMHGVQYADEKADNMPHGDAVDARTLLFKVGASVIAVLLVVVMVSATQAVQHRSSMRKLSFENENVSYHSIPGLALNLSNIARNKALINRPWPAVSAIQFCNYASVRVFPSYRQAEGTVNEYTISGMVVPYENSKCFMFSGNFVAYYGGINGATIQGYYLRDGGSEEPWRRCLGGGFELQTKSMYAGEYQCTGTPPVCKKNGVFVYRRSR